MIDNFNRNSRVSENLEIHKHTIILEAKLKQEIVNNLTIVTAMRLIRIT